MLNTSRQQPNPPPAQPDKKRHHVVPVTYLKGFTDADGKIYAYRKDEPEKPLHLAPDNIGFRKYYYSQPLPGGGWDHNTLEDFFSDTMESKWGAIVEHIRKQEPLPLTDYEIIFPFISALRVRVPAARDAVEYMLAEQVKVTARLLDEMGKLPPKPPGFEDLLDHVEVSIDPHQSIHAMAQQMKGFGNVLAVLGFQILHNATNVPFITSDNSVIHFDPDVPEEVMRPYTVQPGRTRIELMFPIDSQHMLYGHTDLKTLYGQQGITYKTVNDSEIIARFNRLASRFAYEIVFANSTGHEAVIKEYAHVSPVAEVSVIPQPRGKLTVCRHTFGQRRKKPKWERRSE